MTENGAVIKIIAEHTREMEELRAKYMHVMKELSNLINEHTDLKLLYDHVRKENKRLKKLSEDQREEIANDLKEEYEYNIHTHERIYKLIEKWEGKEQ